MVIPRDSQLCEFGSDIGPSNQITTVEFPVVAFHLVAAVWAPDSSSRPEHAKRCRKSVVLTRKCSLMVVPQSYISLVSGATLTPHGVWIRMSVIIFSDNRAVTCIESLQPCHQSRPKISRSPRSTYCTDTGPRSRTPQVRMTGQGLTHHEKKRRRVVCPMCGDPVQVVQLVLLDGAETWVLSESPLLLTQRTS